MITISCPWCEDEELTSFADLLAEDAVFRCDTCGTTVRFEEQTLPLELAA